MSELGDMPVLGDLEQVAQQDFVPVLSGMGMEKTITVFNPLPLDFRVKYTRSVAMNAPMSPEMQYTKEKTGLDLSRRGQVSGHVSHTIVLKAKSLTNLPGDIAQIAVQKLINTIIQTKELDGSYNFDGRGSRKGMIPDPFLRQETEKEVVREIKDTMALMNRETPEDFTSRQIEEMNSPIEEATNEPPAPGTGRNYPPAETVPDGPGQPDTTQPGSADQTEVPEKRKPGRPKAATAKA